MQNRAFLPTRLRNKKCCLFVGWGILRRKLMKLDDMLGKFLTQFVVLVLNYVFSKFFVFAKR